ncbi:MAG: hypothetical protein JJ926_03790 [Roseitalea sp.]|nr:hypothetical protein [Roseitalea sp.]MBO6950978.1 hypothetical protein [Rhizobiaceae bacterium]MBO6591035.1 hypothetical protein [Roseitalea sp.]MBO6599707.1 hypothetical protein [Roseitalea sp.]MBO6611463.1 hypothetical protein [Roseitalea sp.]
MKVMRVDQDTIVEIVDLPDTIRDAEDGPERATKISDFFPDDEPIEEHDGVAQIGWVRPDADSPFGPPPDLNISLDQAKASTRLAAIARADAFTAPILAFYPEAERAGWDKREAEARAIVTAADADADLTAAIAETIIVKAMADAGQWSEAEAVDKARSILVKAAEFAAISAAVEMMREGAMAAIDAAADEDALAATLETLDTEATSLAAQFGLA